MSSWFRPSLLAVVAAATVLPSAAFAADPRVGTWVERKAGPSYMGLRRSFEDLGNGRIRVNIALNAEGKATSSAELACDGQAYPVQGQDGVTLACRALDPRTTDFTFTRAAASGWVKSAGREQVSPDGAVMTVSAIQTDAGGAITARIERVFDRRP